MVETVVPTHRRLTYALREMTKEQIAEAQKLSREMVKANPKLMGD